MPVGTLGHLYQHSHTIFILGFLGTWRYSWAALNFTRAVIFRASSTRAARRGPSSGSKNARALPCLLPVTTYMVAPEGHA